MVQKVTFAKTIQPGAICRESQSVVLLVVPRDRWSVTAAPSTLPVTGVSVRIFRCWYATYLLASILTGVG